VIRQVSHMSSCDTTYKTTNTIRTCSLSFHSFEGVLPFLYILSPHRSVNSSSDFWEDQDDIFPYPFRQSLLYLSGITIENGEYESDTLSPNTLVVSFSSYLCRERLTFMCTMVFMLWTVSSSLFFPSSDVQTTRGVNMSTCKCRVHSCWQRLKLHILKDPLTLCPIIPVLVSENGVSYIARLRPSTRRGPRSLQTSIVSSSSTQSKGFRFPFVLCRVCMCRVLLECKIQRLGLELLSQGSCEKHRSRRSRTKGTDPVWSEKVHYGGTTTQYVIYNRDKKWGCVETHVSSEKNVPDVTQTSD
jgi:hypothetical protein